MAAKKVLLSLRRLPVWAFLAASGAVLLSVTVGLRPRAHPLAAGGGEVHGYVFADLRQQGVERVAPFLPDATAFLRNLASGTESPRVRTDLKGFFIIPPQPAGSYELCLEADGYFPACPQRVLLSGDDQYLQPAGLLPRNSVLYGLVELRDGGPCTFASQVFGVDFATAVRVVDGSGKAVVPPVRANRDGRYVIAGLPAGAFELRAECESAMVQSAVTISPGPAHAIDLQLPNRSPRLNTVVASAGGQAVRQAIAGSTVQVTAFALDDEPLHYRWSAAVAKGGFTSSDTRTVSWTLPDEPGTYTIYVLAQDGHGGVAFGRANVSTMPGVFFSGQVHAAGLPAVQDAVVEVGGATVRTDAAGAFAVQVDASPRYVLTIRKQGFQIYSRVFDAPVVDGSYTLQRVAAVPFDPGIGGRIVERPTRDCARPESVLRPDPRQLRGTLDRPLGTSPCGAEVVLSPGSLVDGSGRPAAGPAQAFLSTLDLRNPDGGFPGEYAGVDGGRESGLNSLGAVDIELFDTAGSRLQLAPGQTALVRIPVDPLQLALPGMPAAAPPRIPIWFYNPRTGLWDREGEAVLAGAFYEATVRHFSTVNADFELTNPACLRIITPTDPDEAPPRLPYKLRASYPAAAPAKTETGTVADALSLLARLPANTQIKLEVLDSEGHVIPTATRTVSTGAASSPAFPAYPYDSCTAEVRMTLGLPTNGGALDYYTSSAAEADAYYAKIDPTATAGAGTIEASSPTVVGTGTSFKSFLQPGHVLKAGGQSRIIAAVKDDSTLVLESPFNPSLPAGTTYERVGEKPTLAAWQKANGFSGGDDQDAVYLNAGDLGLGRWMHMKRDAGHIAYYVSNYGTPPNFGSVEIAAEAKRRGDPTFGLIATVAMEYSPEPGGSSPYTKFYVYDATGRRVNKADLDGKGDKYIPNLCTICHGGSPGTGDARGDGGAHFIPFDVDSFGYARAAGATRAAQEASFKELNRSVRDSTNVTTAIRELIDGWYGGSALPLPSHQSTYVAKGWRLTGTGTPPGTSPVDKSSLYSNVVKPSCRSCHTTRAGRISWDTWDGPAPFDGFKEDGGHLMRSFVCGPGRIMPHALVPYGNFWRSTTPHQPAALGNGGVDGWPPTYPCPCRDASDTNPANAALPVCTP